MAFYFKLPLNCEKEPNRNYKIKLKKQSKGKVNFVSLHKSSVDTKT